MRNVRKSARNLRGFVKKYVNSSRKSDLIELIDDFESIVDEIESGDRESAIESAKRLARKLVLTVKMFRAHYQFDRDALKSSIIKLAKVLSGRPSPRKTVDVLLFSVLPNIQWLAVWTVFRSMLLEILDDVDRMIDDIEGYDPIENKLVSALGEVRTGQDIGIMFNLSKFMNYIADPEQFDGDDELAAEYQDAVRTLGKALDKYDDVAGNVDDFGDMDLGEFADNVEAIEKLMAEAALKWRALKRKLDRSR